MNTLFPIDASTKDWVHFRASGFTDPVCGVIYSADDKVPCGMPLGGVDTGCLDLETGGLLGYCTIFNSHVPRGGPFNTPLLGLNVGGTTWVMSTGKPKAFTNLSDISGVLATWHDVEKSTPPPLELKGVRKVTDIRYWGHYPIADLEFISDAPVSVGMRAWSPFLPGDVKSSMIPGAVFEVHVRNTSTTQQKCSLAFSFPGPSSKETGGSRFSRQAVDGSIHGVAVTSDQASYVLGIIGKDKTRNGGALGDDGTAWANIASRLPDASDDQQGSSVAVDFNLAPGKSKVIRYMLSWYAPTWKGGGRNSSDKGNTFTHMYTKYYPSALAAAELLAKRHELLLRRIIAWQEVIYQDAKLPDWLRDVLINNFHLITETGLWAQAKPPVEQWCKEADGLWGMIESPRACPQMECIPCSWCGGMAVQYAFPQLTLSNLRTWSSRIGRNGEMAWNWCSDDIMNTGCEMVTPSYGGQIGQNGSWFVAMVDRYWRMTGDDTVLREFYTSLKNTTVWQFNLNPARPYGLISLPTSCQQEFFESTLFKGMAAHVAIIRLYHLRALIIMAEKMGDTEFSKKCTEWFDTSLRLMEEHLWSGTYYIQHMDPESGEVAKAIMGYQLDGELIARYHGLEGEVVPAKRVETILATLKSKGMDTWGPRVWSSPSGGPVDDKEFPTGYWTTHGVHAPAGLMLAMTYMYNGQKSYGLELAREIMFNMICRQGWTWDMPILYRGDTGAGIWGNDYGQMMAVWMLPAAVYGEDISGAAKPGALMSRIAKAASGK